MSDVTINEIKAAMPQALRDYIFGVSHLFTGSQAFGYAQADSDWDFVVYRPEATPQDDVSGMGADILHRSNPEYPDTGQPLNFKVNIHIGEVNVIVVNDAEVFHGWGRAYHIVNGLKAIGVPITREVSVAVHRGCVEQYDD